MVLNDLLAGTLRSVKRFSLPAAGFFLILFLPVVLTFGQTRSIPPGAPQILGIKASLPSGSASDAAFDLVDQFEGLKLERIDFDGVDRSRFTPLPDRLARIVGTPLTQEKLAIGLRAVYATGLFETVDVEAVRDGEGVDLIFKGTPRMFIGTVTVIGAKGATINTQLERASRLQPGTRFTDARLKDALDQMRQTLADNGFHEPVIAHQLTPHPAEQLVDVAFTVNSGSQSHVGSVQVNGEPGISVDEFRRRARLRAGARIDRDTPNRALSGVLKHYQKQDRLEAEVKLESQNCSTSTKRCDFAFTANRGPIVRLRVQGASVDGERLKHAIPVFEEGTVDEDLLNEGNRNLRDYFQRLGYFDVKVDHERQAPGSDEVVIVYQVDLGVKRRVEHVAVSGNHYFSTDTLKDLLSVHAADTFDRRGLYNQALVTADVGALQAVYQNNGFAAAKVTPKTTLVALTKAGRSSSKPAGLAIDYQIAEGAQQRVGTVTLEGNAHTEAAKLLPLLNTAPGQLLSPQNLAGDRDTLVTDYLSRGFDQAHVEVEQEPGENATTTNIVFHITEGQQVFVRQVLLTGLVYTRPDTVARAITLHPGDPLNQTALLETQRNLYDFALFNEVNAVVENPTGVEAQKNVLLQATEARRWTLTYGLGFEAQTGTPQNNCAGYNAVGTPCSPNGKTSISPRILGDITRNALFGREESASIQGTYGLLEQKVDLIFQNPRFYGNPNFGMTFSGGYANSQAVTTYVASKLDAGMRWTQHFNGSGKILSRANTFIYEFDFRRVKVAASSLQVFPTEIPLLSEAVRVAGPGFTWLRDTRDSPLDAHRGTYTSFQDFSSIHTFGSEAQFNRLDLSNSSFYGFDKNRFVLARNTRYAQERAFGTGSDELIPLPERLYSGGPTSLRGFSVNAAGPRDPETGFPIGGAGALVNSTELRLPPPVLPWVGDSVSFVLFHDMGNVFANPGDAWVSALRIHQPDRDACRILTPPDNSTNPPTPPMPSSSNSTLGPDNSTGQQGACSFSYFSHAAGLGLRYHTPVGPIRLDFSYNLNPPIYPVNVNYSLSNPYSDQHVGEAPHFNFFFSLGQTF
jgi:outer membrane protein assembly complex protein YaeT